MGYELELPRDVQTDIEEFLEQFSGGDIAVARDAVVAELAKLEVNPRLGTPNVGGPSERRLFYWFQVRVAGETVDLQLAYRVNEERKLVTAHGFSLAPNQ